VQAYYDYGIVLPDPETGLRLALIFVIIATCTGGLIFVVLYWGFETWLLFLGWFYALNSVATARFLLRLRTPYARARSH